MVFRKLMLIFWVTGSVLPAHGQTLLEADGPAGDTYELINTVLAPGYDTVSPAHTVVESPDCIDPLQSPHITEVLDQQLNQYVFAFHIHRLLDNDRCLTDVKNRQRMEIKTDSFSPDYLIGVLGETVVYRWKFYLPADFKPSSGFNHLHQLKAVGGDDGMPVFTLTARKGSPNTMELRHDNNLVMEVNLALFENNWVEVTERIKIDNVNGTYAIDINNISTGASILSYNNNSLMTIRAGNDFLRPKWGIYRELAGKDNELLNDEDIIYFAGFSIEEEVSVALPVSVGWGLFSSAVGFQVESLFGDSEAFTSVWKWTDNSSGGKTWAVFLPGYDDWGVAYAQSKGFVPITAMAPGEGFWLNSKVEQQVQVSGLPADKQPSLSSGWNLVGVQGTKATLASDLEGAINSVWKWTTCDNSETSTWAVNLPGAADKGASYAAAKGFCLLSAIQPGEGFWVNKP